MATYADITTLMNSSGFRDAVTIAVAKFASYVLGEASDVPFHTQRVVWAKGAYQSPSATAGGLLAVIALDPNIQAALPTPSDAVIQSATETAINTTMTF